MILAEILVTLTEVILLRLYYLVSPKYLHISEVSLAYKIGKINSYSDCKPIGGFKHVNLTNFKKKIPKKDRLSIGLYHLPNLQEIVVTEATAYIITPHAGTNAKNTFLFVIYLV